MKTKQLFFSICLIAIAVATNAQIKVTTGGKSTIGYAGTPPSYIRTHLVGNTLFSLSSSGKGAMIRGYNGVSSATKPDYTWYNDSTTGIFQNATGQIQFSISGYEKFKIKSNGQLVSTTSSSVAGAPEFSWQNDPNTGVFNPAANALAFSTDGTERMRIESSGKVMIGVTSSLNDKLTIVAATDQNTLRTTASHTADYGYAHYSSVNRANTKNWAVNLSGTGETFYVLGSGDLWAKSGTWWSDRILKENIDTIDDALSKVLRLNGVEYNFKASFTGLEVNEKEIGLIAQEVESVVPEVVRTNNNGIKGIAYQNLIPLLIEAIKVQNTEIQQLKTDITSCCNAKSVNGVGNRTISNNTDITNVETTNWLAQNKPNPFNKETVIEYNVIQEGKGNILVFDMNGKLLKTIPVKIPGKGSVTITANDLPAGMYYYTLVVNDTEVDTKKMILTQ